MDISIRHAISPDEVEHIVQGVKINCYWLKAVCNLHRDRFQLNPSNLLEVSKLGNLHTVEPYLPPKPPCPECRRFPIVFNKPEIMLIFFKSKRCKALQIDILNIIRDGLQDYLELIVMLEAVGVLAIPAVSGSPRRLNIRNPPGLRPQYPEECSRIECAGPDFNIVRLSDYAAPVCPKSFK